MITSLPTPPLPTDTTAVFNTRAFNLLNALPLFVTETNDIAVQVSTDAGTASVSATAAADSAFTAAASANYKGEWSTLSGALNIPASVSNNGQLYILKNNIANVAASQPGVSSDWLLLGGSRLVMLFRTSNTIIDASNVGDFIEITSGTFTQTFDTIGNLGKDWYCYIRNNGTGDVTLDPAASETIDGRTSFVMYPGETRLLHCDGSVLRSVVLSGFSKTFTASGNFIKPPGYSFFEALIWSGGNSGQKSGGAGDALGGGGGGCFPARIPASSLSASTVVTVGAGGAARTTTSTGALGGDSSIGTLVVVKQSTILYTYGGAVMVGAAAVRSANDGGGDFGYAVGGSTASIWGGGAAAASSASNGSIYGGGAGGSYSSGSLRTPGASSFGGAGGAAGDAVSGTDGTAPGGGGGGTRTGAQSGSGARGEVRIWGVA